MLGVEIHEHPDSAAEAGWDSVVKAAGAPVFYQSDYLAAYHRDPLGDIVYFRYLLVREPGRAPIAALPVALHRRADPLGLLRDHHPGVADGSALLSHVWHCYDTQIVGAVAGTVRPLLETMRGLATGWGASWYGLVNVERGGPTAAALRAAGWRGEHLVDRFWADLTGLTDLDGYLARLGPRARANLARTARRARDAGLTCTVRPVAVVDLAEVGDLCARTAARFGNAGFYPPDTFARFVTAVGPLAHVLSVRHGTRLVAVGICLTDEHRFHTWTCGVEYDVPGNASPYALLFAESVRLAIELGRPVLEGGRSNATFKRRHGLTPIPLDAYLRPV